MGGIRTEHLAKRFGSKEILKNVCFHAPPGKITLIAGRNGTGKTTWIRLALGLARPTNGQILFDGKRVSAIRSSIAVVFDEPPVYGHLSGAENLRLLSGGGSVRSSSPQDILQALELDQSLLRQKTRGYSLGQRRRLAVAAALLRRPRFLFLDEPTIGLDPIAWEMVREAIKGVADEGATVILTGQDFSEIERIFDWVVVLSQGRIAFEGSGQEFRGLRPPRVRVVTSMPERVLAEYAGAHITETRPVPVVDIPVSSEEEAERLVRQIATAEFEVKGVSMVTDSLEEAFLAALDAERGSTRSAP